MWRILHHRGHHSCINLHGEDDALTGRGIFRFTPHEPRAPTAALPAHLCAVHVRAVFSRLCVRERLRVLLLPLPRLSEAHEASAAGIRHPLCGKSILRHLHADFAGRVAGEIASAGRVGFRAFPFDYRFERCARIPDHAHGRQHVLPVQTATSSTTGIYHIFATTADYATETPLVGWLVGGLNHHIVHHLCPFVCHTHYAPLTRIVKQTAEEYRHSLSATSDHDAGDQTSSTTLEAVGEPGSCFSSKPVG